MPDARITGGRVVFVQRKNLGNYEHKEATAELLFNTDEKTDFRDLFDQAGHEAQGKVEHLLGGGGAINRPAPSAEGNAPAAGKPARTRTPKPEGSTSAPAPSTSSAAGGDTSGPSGGSNTPDPLGDLGGVTSSSEASGGSNTAPDPLGGLGSDLGSDLGGDKVPEEWETAGVPEGARKIDDAELIKACGVHNARLGATGPGKIRSLIAQFAPPAGPARNIPADKRVGFLAALDALTP